MFGLAIIPFFPLHLQLLAALETISKQVSLHSSFSPKIHKWTNQSSWKFLSGAGHRKIQTLSEVALKVALKAMATFICAKVTVSHLSTTFTLPGNSIHVLNLPLPQRLWKNFESNFTQGARLWRMAFSVTSLNTQMFLQTLSIQGLPGSP